LNEDLSRKLLGLKIHKINFSINGTEKSYHKIMSLDYNKTKDNILEFIGLKKKMNLKLPLVNISLMIVDDNKEEIENIIKFWKGSADSIMAYGPSDWAGSLKVASVANQNPFIKKRWPCSFLWTTIMVDVEGNVIMCCRDYESKVKFGNLLKKNILDIRSGKDFSKLLDKHKKGEYNTPVCSSCDNVFDSSLNWW
jgi:radical SAM protein with 4Fe4S-binding SPASM domain